MGKEIDEFQKAMQELMKAKLPISRTVVDKLTKLGFAAMTHYKHVVIIVEKFIQKCKPAYKLAGLYIIDALVRYNIKHRGRKADVLGPRFIKNFTTTFENIVKCPSRDFPKIIRVLNLWQAGKVYSCDVIQPLLDIITKAVVDKDSSRSPSVCGPSTPPHEDVDNPEATQGLDSLDLDSFPKTPPLPEPEDSVSARLRSLLACNKPPSPEKPLNQPQSTETHRNPVEKFGTAIMPSTSENIRKLGEFLNGSTDETQNDTSGALSTANSAEFLELLKTVNNEFSKEFLPGSSEKSQEEGDLDDHHLKTDLEQEILGTSNDHNMFAAESSPVLAFISPEKPSSRTDPNSADKKDHHGSSKQIKGDNSSNSRKRKPSPNSSLTVKLNKLNETLKNEMEVENKNQFSSGSRNYRKRDSSPVPNLLSSISSGADLSSDDGGSSRKLSKSKSKKMKKHESREKSSKKRKSKKKKKKKDKKSRKSKNVSSSDEEDTAKSVSTSEMPTRSLKDEMEWNLKKWKNRKMDNFDLKRALESDPSVNYGPKDYPKKCVIVFSTVLSISNITDLSFKRMNDLLKNFGTVLSVEMVVSVNKALVNYSERKSACAALVSLRAQNEFGISWAFPKPVSKQPWIEMWDGAVGCCVIPWEKAPSDLFNIFSEGCFIDKSTIPSAEFTKPNEVTSSTDNCGGTNEENQRIKKKIAEMIAKSEKTASTSETSNSTAENKNSSNSCDSANVSGEHLPSTFKSIASSSESAPSNSESSSRKNNTGGSFKFGWGPSPYKKKGAHGGDSKSESAKADSTTDCTIVFDSMSSKSNSKSTSKSTASHPSLTDSTALSLNGSDSCAQYQSYVQSQAAMYQMAYGAYSSYPYMSGVPSSYGSYAPEMAYAAAAYSAYNYQMYPHQNIYGLYNSSSQHAADHYQMNYVATDTTSASAASTRSSKYASGAKSYASNSKTSVTEAQWVNASPYNSSSDVDFRSYLLNISKPSSTASYVSSTITSSSANYSTSVASQHIVSSNYSKAPVVSSSAENSSCEAPVVVGGPMTSTPKSKPQPPPPNVADLDEPPLPPKTSDGKPIVENIDSCRASSESNSKFNRHNDAEGLLSRVSSATDVTRNGYSSGAAVFSGQNQKINSNDSRAYESVSKAVAVLQNFDSLRRSVTTEYWNNSRESYQRRLRDPNKDVYPLHNEILANPSASPLDGKFQNERIRLQMSKEEEFVDRLEREQFHSANPTRYLLKTPETLNSRLGGPRIELNAATNQMRSMVPHRNPVLPCPEAAVRPGLPHQRAPVTQTPIASGANGCAFKPAAISDGILRPRTQCDGLSITRSPVIRLSNAQTVVKPQPVFRTPAIRPDIAAQKTIQHQQVPLTQRPAVSVSVNTRTPVINPSIRGRQMVPIVLEKASHENNFSSPRLRLETCSNENANTLKSRRPVLDLSLDLPGHNSRAAEIRPQREESLNSSGIQRSSLEAQAEHILRREMQAVFNARAAPPSQNTLTSNEAIGRVRALTSLVSQSSRQYEGAFNFKSFDNYSEKHAREKVQMDSKIGEGRHIGSLFQPMKDQNDAKSGHVTEISSSPEKSNGIEKETSSHDGIQIKVFNDFAAEKNMVPDDGSMSTSDANHRVQNGVLDSCDEGLQNRPNSTSSLKTSNNIFAKVMSSQDCLKNGEAHKSSELKDDVIIANSESSVSTGSDSSGKTISRVSDKSTTKTNSAEKT